MIELELSLIKYNPNRLTRINPIKFKFKNVLDVTDSLENVYKIAKNIFIFLLN